MSDPLYGKELLRLAADAHGAGRLAEPDATGHAHNPACGDKVTIDVMLADGRIKAISQETKACVLTQASASILGRSLNGATRAEVELLRRMIETMLKTRGPSPPPPFGAFGALRAAAAYPNRHRCVLLTIDAVLAAFDESEARKAGGVGT